MASCNNSKTKLEKDIRQGSSYELYVYRDESSLIRHTGFLIAINVQGEKKVYTIDYGAQSIKAAAKSFAERGEVTCSEVVIVQTAPLTNYMDFIKILSTQIDGKLFHAKRLRDESNLQLGAVLLFTSDDCSLMLSIIGHMFTDFEPNYKVHETKSNCRGYVGRHIELIKTNITDSALQNANKLLGVTVVQDLVAKLAAEAVGVTAASVTSGASVVSARNASALLKF